jgi:hypothetical protein
VVTFRDEAGTELFDLPDAPRPDAEVEAPVRLLGQFDNVILGHADRRRIVPEGLPWEPMRMRERHMSNLLVDGELRGAWWVEDGSLVIRAIRALGRRERAAVAAEAERMLGFLGAGGDVRLEAA